MRGDSRAPCKYAEARSFPQGFVCFFAQAGRWARGADAVGRRYAPVPPVPPHPPAHGPGPAHGTVLVAGNPRGGGHAAMDVKVALPTAQGCGHVDGLQNLA